MASPSSQTVLITGATGYVAAHVIASFLKAGYNVRGTVRSERSISTILADQGFSGPTPRLTFTIVPDMTAPHAFDEAVKGVTGVIHTASPFVLNPKDTENELLKPAINGTTSVLAAAAAHAGPQLTRVVITSSFASIMDMSKGYRPGYTYTESDFNPATYKEAAESDNGGFSYCASKGLAERAAWDWMTEHKPHFTLATLCPPWIFGPYLAPIKDLNKLGESVSAIRGLIGAKQIPPTDFAGFADVRDVAEAHLLAYQSPKAAGQRFIVGNHFDYQTAADVIREDVPEAKDKVPEGVKGAGLKEEVYQIDGSKVEKLLDLKYTPLNVTMRDTVRQLLKAGAQ